MRKEIIFAIVFGGIIGLVVAFGIWRVNSAFKPKDKPQASATPTPRPDYLISVAKPESEDVLTSSPTQVTGLTRANALIAVSGEGADYVTNAASDGTFSENVALLGGTNQILLAAFDEAGTPTQTDLLVVYSSEFAKELATKDGDSVKEKVEQKVAEAINRPKAYLGTITNIAGNTIQIKSQTGEIQQVGITGNTVYVDTDPTVKTVTVKDVAIGDFIVAMGFTNGNSVLNAKRILITPPLEKIDRQILLGKITKTTTKDFTIIAKDNVETTVTPAKGVTYLLRSQDKFVKSKFADLEEEAEVVVFGTPGEKSFSARTVFILTN